MPRESPYTLTVSSAYLVRSMSTKLSFWVATSAKVAFLLSIAL